MTTTGIEALKIDVDTNTVFSNPLIKNDIVKINPSSATSTLLNQAGEIEFQCLHSTKPLDISNAKLYYKIKIKDKDKRITLENNFFPSLFNAMSLKIGGTIVEKITSPGIISTMLNLILVGKSKSRYQESYGWIPDIEYDDTGTKSFIKRKELYKDEYCGYFPLNQLFGFLQNYNRLLHHAYIELLCNRQINDKLLFFGEKGSTAKLELLVLQLHIPVWNISPEVELAFVRRLNTDNPIRVSFLNRINGKYTMETGTSYSIKLGNLAFKPRYIIIGIKDISPASYENNNNRFIQQTGSPAVAAIAAIAEVKDKDGNITIPAQAAKAAIPAVPYNSLRTLQVQLNNDYYPRLPMEFNSLENNNIFPYQAYVDVVHSFFQDPYLNIKYWSKTYPIFCIDLSAQDTQLIINNVEVNLHLTKDSDFKGDLHWVILEDKNIEMKLAQGKVVLIENLKGLNVK